MIKMTAQDAIKMLTEYSADEPLIIGWWDKACFDATFEDGEVKAEDQPDLWEEVTDNLDGGFDRDCEYIFDTIDEQVREVIAERNKKEQ